jgi:hypothetical protein
MSVYESLDIEILLNFKRKMFGQGVMAHFYNPSAQEPEVSLGYKSKTLSDRERERERERGV